MRNKYIGAILIYYVLQLLTQHCGDAVVIREVPGKNVPSELFQTVEAPTEQAAAVNPIPASNSSYPQPTGTSLTESTKTSASTNSHTPFTMYRPGMSPPSSSHTFQGSFRPVPGFPQPSYPSGPFPMRPQASGIPNYDDNDNFPFTSGGSSGGSGSSSSSYYSSSSSTSVNGEPPVVTRFESGPGMSYYSSSSSTSVNGEPPVVTRFESGPTMSRFRRPHPMNPFPSGPSMGPFPSGPSMGPFPSGPSMRSFSSGPSMGSLRSGPSGFTSHFEGGNSDGFYSISSGHTTSDSIGPITRNIEYDSRRDGGFFRKK